jgi:hypothetical protein
VRSAFSGVSVGISLFAVDEARDVVDARWLLATEDLVETPAEDRVDRVEALGAMVAVCSVSSRVIRIGCRVAFASAVNGVRKSALSWSVMKASMLSGVVCLPGGVPIRLVYYDFGGVDFEPCPFRPTLHDKRIASGPQIFFSANSWMELRPSCNIEHSKRPQAP